MADPGFPVGGLGPHVGGGMDSQGGYVSKILYVKMKESGPLGGSANAKIRILESLVPEFFLDTKRVLISNLADWQT